MDVQKTTQPCPYCGEEIKIGAKKCRHCNEWLEEPPVGYLPDVVHSSSNDGNRIQPQQAQMPQYFDSGNARNTVIVNQEVRKSNVVGTAGFVLALISLFFSWIPGVNWLFWFLGTILSFMGLFKSPRGLAIVGFVISMIDVIILIALIGAVGGILSNVL